MAPSGSAPPTHRPVAEARYLDRLLPAPPHPWTIARWARCWCSKLLVRQPGARKVAAWQDADAVAALATLTCPQPRDATARLRAALLEERRVR